MDFKVEFWNSRIAGMGGPTDIEQKGCESVIHDHDCDLLVIKIRYKDLPDSDRVTSDVGVSSIRLVDCTKTTIYLWGVEYIYNASI